MDDGRFDSLTRSLAAAETRRGLLGSLAALGAGLLGARGAGAQVTQAQCGNKVCAANPGVCTNGCVCCVYGNGNSRCRPPQDCTAPGTVLCPPGQTPISVLNPAFGCAPTTTTTTTTAAPAACPSTPCDEGFERDPQRCACDVCPSGLICTATLGVPRCCPSASCVCTTNATGCDCL